MTKQYKWDSPHDWLGDYIDHSQTPEEIRYIACTLASVLDSDQIQDLFQSEMSDDGYFKLLKPPRAKA